MEQKGKNYADKRDITDVTQKVEEVKSQYAKTLSLINANFSLASKGIETFESEQFKSYIAFHQACSYILNDISNLDVGALRIKLDLSVSVEKQRDLIREAFQPLRKAKANHDLFNDNKQIGESAAELYQMCFKYSNTLHDLFAVLSIHQATRNHIREMKGKMTSHTPIEEVKEWAELDGGSKAELIQAKEDVVKYISGIEIPVKCHHLIERVSRHIVNVDISESINACNDIAGLCLTMCTPWGESDYDKRFARWDIPCIQMRNTVCKQ